ncbi:MAG: hypothetical protein ABII25_02595, partial [bacterium]
MKSIIPWFFGLSIGIKISMGCGAIIVAVIVVVCFLLITDKKLKARKERKKNKPKEEKKEDKKNDEKSYWYHCWRSALIIAPVLVIGYLFIGWTRFDGTLVQFVLTQRVLGWIFGLALV